MLYGQIHHTLKFYQNFSFLFYMMKIVHQLKPNLITLHFFCFLKDENDLAQYLRIILMKFLALFTFESLSKYLHSIRFKTTTYTRDVYTHTYFKYIKNPHLQQVAC